MPEFSPAAALPTGAGGTEYRRPGAAWPAGRQAFGRKSLPFTAGHDTGNGFPAGLSGPRPAAGRR
jgi:hypothetical protein